MDIGKQKLISQQTLMLYTSPNDIFIRFSVYGCVRIHCVYVTQFDEQLIAHTQW